MVFLSVFALGACSQAVTTGPAPVRPPVSPPIEFRDGPATDDWWRLDPVTDHVPGIGVERAYAELLANRSPRREVVVAILDSGIDVEHEDLAAVIWTNPGEIPGNNRDDDGNGYIDDVHGWNFIGGPDGRNVHQDTYEVTRLYKVCRDSGQLATPRCQAIAEEVEGRRAEAQGYLDQYLGIAATQEQILSVLQNYLGTTSVTVETVQAISSSNPEVSQARQVYLRMMDAGATPEVIQEGIEQLTNQLDYNFNPDFNSRLIVGDDYSNLTQRFYGNSDVRGPDALHGTHVAGIVGAVRNNGIGINGIASGVRIMSVRTVPDGDERDKDVANAIRYAVDNGASVLNMSFGKGYSPDKPIVDEAVRYAMSKGVLLVHAAGNDGEDLATHENFPNPIFVDGERAGLWLEVGASGYTHDGLAASFSNYGTKQVDVFAPGVSIYSTVPDNEYRRLDGTSMAAPVVTGLAALLMAYYPELSAAQVKQIIMETVSPFQNEMVILPGSFGQRRAFGELSVAGGVVNAYEALKRAAEITTSRN
jgi:subtilisin family serine protease